MVFGLHEILCIVAIAHLSLFSLFLVTQQKGKRLSNGLLAAFLFSKCLGIVNHLIYRLEVQNPHVYFVLVPFAFLWGPSLYFYIRSLVYKDFRLLKRHVIHLAPFVLAWAYFIVVYHARSVETKVQILNSTGDYSSMNEIVFVGLLHLLIAGYICASILTLWRYRRNLKDVYSSLEEINFSWMNVVLFGFTFIWGIDVFQFILATMGRHSLFLSSSMLVMIVVFAHAVVYKGLRQPEIFSGIDQKAKYQQSPLTKEEKEKYLVQLQCYMEREKPYLNPGLSINRLAKQLVIPSRYLSQVINETLGMNFYDYVNRFRVEEAKNLFMDTSNNERNILELLFDAGFNTKSVFNRVFKKYTGMTPSEFKRTHQG